MIVSNPSLVPEFQYYFNQFVVNSSVNRYSIPLPVQVDLTFLTSGSVVELLCSEVFPYSTYTYLYENNDSKQCWPQLTRQRLMVYQAAKYLVPGTTGDNIFNLQTHDFVMLDTLLQYRHDSTSVSIIDSTSLELVIDATSGLTILYASLDILNTPLSKLIYLYLQLKLYGYYQGYNNLNVISTCTLLETCFELKLIDEYFDYISSREITFDIDCST